MSALNYSLEALVVGGKDLPTGRAHEAWGWGLAILGHLAHARARDELEVSLVAGLRVEELHSSVDFVVSSHLEWQDLNALEHIFAVDEKLLAVPDIVKIDTGLLGVLHTSGVAAGDEVGDAAVDAGGGVPHNLGGTTVVHGGWPHSEDGVLRSEGSVSEESGVLLHAVVERHVVILAPAT